MKLVLNDNGLRALINFRIDVIEHFIAQGHQVVLIYPACTREEDLINKIPTECKVYEVDMLPSGNNPLKDFAYFKQLYKIYKKEKPDLVFHYTIKPNIYGTFAATLLKIKRVDMVAGLGYIFTGNGLSKKIGRLLYKIGLRMANRVITLNSENRDLLVAKGFVLEKNMILYGGGKE
ncbi:MAG: glycosyltransferase [Bacteroidota bacterium]|nr:glycosyltransferase [Bacteroidota bacterium]